MKKGMNVAYAFDKIICDSGTFVHAWKNNTKTMHE